jgi:outer membrane protein assembly factor BamE (lipoprotein component of BamABCDE complex)
MMRRVGAIPLKTLNIVNFNEAYMQKVIQIISLLFCFSFIGGCSFCPTFKADVTQGNVIKCEAVDQLRLGMTVPQVLDIMGGHPVLENTFCQNRLHYVYLFERHGHMLIKKRVVLVFDNGKLVSIDRNVPPGPDIYPSY